MKVHAPVCASVHVLWTDRGEEGGGAERLPEGEHREEAGLLPCGPAPGDLRRRRRRGRRHTETRSDWSARRRHTHLGPEPVAWLNERLTCQ